MEFLNERNFIGYGKTKPKLFWPDKNKLAISFVVNIEEGAELSISSGDKENESVYENNLIQIGGDIPDLCMESHFEYGLRAGIWRIFHLLDQYKFKVTFSCCSDALVKSPWLIDEILKRGHEISAHSKKWVSHSSFDEQEERKIIHDCYDTIYKLTGIAPIGWHTRSSTSPYTRQLLIEHGGFLYDSNAYNDDFPYSLKLENEKYIIMPYSFDTNDMRFERSGGFVHANDFSSYCVGAFDQLLSETKDGSMRMMSIGLHPRIIGRPGRINGLETLLKHIQTINSSWVSSRAEIAKSFQALKS